MSDIHKGYGKVCCYLKIMHWGACRKYLVEGGGGGGGGRASINLVWHTKKAIQQCPNYYFQEGSPKNTYRRLYNPPGRKFVKLVKINTF